LRNGTGQGPVVGFCDDSDKPSGSVTRRKLLISNLLLMELFQHLTEMKNMLSFTSMEW